MNRLLSTIMLILMIFPATAILIYSIYSYATYQPHTYDIITRLNCHNTEFFIVHYDTCYTLGVQNITQTTLGEKAQ